jgi:hypothetical protein
MVELFLADMKSFDPQLLSKINYFAEDDTLS